MPQNHRLDIEEKIALIRSCINGETGIKEAAKIAQVSSASIRRWISRYKSEGEEAFLIGKRNRVYTLEQKQQAVLTYISGEGSLLEISQKFKLSNPSILSNWVKIYQSQGQLDSVKFSGGGSYITKGRRVTPEERLEIVMDCIAAGKNYGQMAIKHNISYQQARIWTIRFEQSGEEGLQDQRGRPYKNNSTADETAEDNGSTK